MIRPILKTFVLGVVFGLGFSAVLGVALYAYKANMFDKVIGYVKSSSQSVQAMDVVPFDDKNAPVNPYMSLSRFQQTPIPADYSVHFVSNPSELMAALRVVAAKSGNGAIVLSDGLYNLNTTLMITVPNVMLLSKSSDPGSVILKGKGMQRSEGIENLIHVSASGFVLDGITLKDAGNHLIQIAAEQNADMPVIRNCILQDGYEQLIKVSYDLKTPESFSDAGLVEYCLFEYTHGIGPNYYIGGIDAHGIRNWIIRNNVFKDISSPGEDIAEYAIHVWSNASNNMIQGNVVIDSDRAIGFGMREGGVRYSNYGGTIKDNIIYHSNNNDKFADTGIALENSPKTLIEGNLIFLEHDYPRAIEYRYQTTNNVIIKKNQTNKSIASRDGGQAKLIDNNEDLERVDFLIKLNTRLGEFGVGRFLK